jgi:hypothetical protein
VTIPKGWTLYVGPTNWKLVKGAKFFDKTRNRWRSIDGGAYATHDGPLIVREKFRLRNLLTLLSCRE